MILTDDKVGHDRGGHRGRTRGVRQPDQVHRLDAAHELGEGLVMLAAIFAGAAVPILPMQILWINMAPAAVLGPRWPSSRRSPTSCSVRRAIPKRRSSPAGLIGRILLVSLILLVGAFGSSLALGKGASDAYAQTVAVNVFVMAEVFYVFNCRSLSKSMFQLGVFWN